MSSSKSKNIIIIILLLLDLILLTIMLLDNASEKNARLAEADAIRQVMSMNGIEVDDGVDFDISAPSSCEIVRDPKTEQQLMLKIIGNCSVNDLGGNILHYTAEHGQGLLRGDGELDIIFSGERPGMDLSGNSALKFVRSGGLSLYADSELISGNDITLCCALDAYCVYNAKLTFTVVGGDLSMINGTRIFNGQITYSDNKSMDCVTAMMRFLEIIRDEGYICSRISDVDAGYFHSVTVSGVSSLTPVWRIETDTGELFINAVSGKIETLTA